MQFRLYLLDVSELEDDNLQQKALSLMDSYRRGKVNQYKTRKDRLHQIATGLLLQVGLLELEIPERQILTNEQDIRNLSTCVKNEVSGEIFLCKAGEIVVLLESFRNASTNIYDAKVNGKIKEIQNGVTIPIEAMYEIKQDGKPFWEQEFLECLPFEKKFQRFSISHSGRYVALVICDKEVGLDIQQERKTSYIGGCQEFCRMEAYVKCTGEGYAKGFKKYKENGNSSPDFCFYKIDVLSDYVIYLCHFNEY